VVTTWTETSYKWITHQTFTAQQYPNFIVWQHTILKFCVLFSKWCLLHQNFMHIKEWQTSFKNWQSQLLQYNEVMKCYSHYRLLVPLMIRQNTHPQPLAHKPNMGLYVERPMINHQRYGQAVNNCAMICMYLWCNRHGYRCASAFYSVVAGNFQTETGLLHILPKR
jgi:hypothetical protein